jgi:DNA repair protein RadC
MGEACRAYSLPGKAELPVPGWKPVPGGRLRQVRVRYGRGPVKVAKGTKIVLPADAWAAFRDLRDEPVEVFRVAFLDWGNHLMAYEDVARGTVSRVHIHPREVFFSAVHLRASAIIALHNHPDQRYPKPSEDDLEVTRRLQEAGRVLGIKLLDHIIVGLEKYYSFQDNLRL